MKKVFLMIAAALVGFSAMAQVQFGVKVGFDMTNFWGEGAEHGMKPSYQAGALLEFKVSDRFAISPEVVFASQGGKFKISPTYMGWSLSQFGVKDITATYYTNYINVPVMLKFYATPSFAIDFGPQVGFNVYSKASVSDGDESLTIGLKDMTKTVDYLNSILSGGCFPCGGFLIVGSQGVGIYIEFQALEFTGLELSCLPKCAKLCFRLYKAA